MGWPLMVVPTWDLDLSVDAVEPNVGGTLDVDLRLHPWVANAAHFPLRPGDWEAATTTVAAEQVLVARADEGSHNSQEFEDLLDASEAEHSDDEWSGLDLGVAGLVLALNAAGFATASSCRRHVGRPPTGDGPFVFATGDADRIALLTPLVADAGAGLDQGALGEGFAVYATSLTALMRLASLVLRARRQFEALPETIGWDQDAYENELD